MKEIEVLVKVIEQKKTALAKLSKFGKYKIKKTHDIYYYHKSNTNLLPNSSKFPKDCFRLRKKDDKTFIAYKRDYFDNNKWIYSDEYETEVLDHKTIKTIIQLLGFKKLVELSNTKYTFETDNLEIVLEEVKNLGLFLEIESKGKQKRTVHETKINIHNIINSSGVQVSDEINAGKPELVFNKLKSTKKLKRV